MDRVLCRWVSSVSHHGAVFSLSFFIAPESDGLTRFRKVWEGSGKVVGKYGAISDLVNGSPKVLAI